MYSIYHISENTTVAETQSSIQEAVLLLQLYQQYAS